MQRRLYIQNTPLDEARELYFNRLEELGFFKRQVETVPVIECQGRVTASAVKAQRSVPHYLASAMDGIAVMADRTAGASESHPILLKPEADYLVVDTGEPIPAGFDAVIMIEDVNFDDDQARIIKAAVPWQHIRPVGEDLVSHDLIAPSLTMIGPYEKAAFLNAGVKTVDVIKIPKIAVIPTGTELIPYTADIIGKGQITETNSWMLAGLAEKYGAIAIKKSIVIDEFELIKNAVMEAIREADIVAICSGSSAGREDYTASVVEELGELINHGLAIKPGKPAILGAIEGRAIIGVPGYPVSAALVFNLFARPLIYNKLGQKAPEEHTLQARMARNMPSSMGVDEFVYVNLARIGNDNVAFPLSRGAGISSTLVKADGYTIIPRGWEGLESGTSCEVRLWRPVRDIERGLVAIGSHDLSIDILADLLRLHHGVRLASSNAGSMGGVMALKNGECHFAGVHLLDTKDGSYNISYLKRFLPDRHWMLLHIARRQQGFAVLPGNPSEITGIRSLAKPGLRYINRQKGSGTRLLLDYLLDLAGLNPDQINGYTREVHNHLSVAAAIHDGTADAGLAIYASARALDLDFVPVDEESYDICILPDLMPEGSMESLLNTINNPAFKAALLEAGGYNVNDTGRILYENNN